MQELHEVTPETSLKITIARWLTPNGRSLSKEGLEPDIGVTVEEETEGADHQLERAIQYLKEGR